VVNVDGSTAQRKTNQKQFCEATVVFVTMFEFSWNDIACD